MHSITITPLHAGNCEISIGASGPGLGLALSIFRTDHPGSSYTSMHLVLLLHPLILSPPSVGCHPSLDDSTFLCLISSMAQFPPLIKGCLFFPTQAHVS